MRRRPSPGLPAGEARQGHGNGQLMLATGLAICLTLITIGNDLAQNQVPGSQLTRTSSLGHHMANLEREFPQALSYRMTHNYLYQGAGEETVRELFLQTRAPFQRELIRQGLACTIELDQVLPAGPSRFQLEWTYLITDDRGHTTLADNATFTLPATDPWWNPDFPYRYGIEVDLPNPERKAPLSSTVNFTGILARLGVTGRFDADSLRVVGQVSSTNQSLEVAAGFLPVSGYSSLSDARGEVVWANEPGYQHYYLYFDIIRVPEPVRSAPRGGGLTVNATGWLTHIGFNWQWELVNNSHLRIFSHTVSGSDSGGWLIAGQQTNWTALEVKEATNGALVLDLTSGSLTRRFTVWAGSPVMAWEDTAGGDGNLTGARTESFGGLINASRDGYRYTIQYRPGAYMATIVPAADPLNVTSGAGKVIVTSNATRGYLVFDYQGSLSGTEVAEHVANLASVQFTPVGTHRLEG